MADDFTLSDEIDISTEEKRPRTLIPTGKYRAEVVAGSVSETKSGKGTLLNLQWQITSGDHDKRMLFQSILVRHESPEAQRYGRYTLKDLCDAIDVTGVLSDIRTLFFKPCIISVGIEKDKSGIYEDKNKVGRIMPAGAATVPPPYNPPPNSKIETGVRSKRKTIEDVFGDEVGEL